MSDYFPINWVDSRVVVRKSPPNTFFGVCGYSRRAALVGGYLEPLVVKDVIIGDECEERARCIDVECTYNQTTSDSLRKALHIKSGRLPDLKSPAAINQSEPHLEFFRRITLDHPDGGAVILFAEQSEQRYRKKAIPPAIRWEVWERDDFTCRECGTRQLLSVDHVYPEVLGGTLTLDNLQTLCRSCNAKKGARVR